MKREIEFLLKNLILSYYEVLEFWRWRIPQNVGYNLLDNSQD
jgi:hypothetical protein